MENQSLIEHLTELRQRLIYCALALLIGAAASYAFSEQIFDLIRAPIAPFLERAGLTGLVFTAPMDKFIAHIKVSLLSGLIVTSPFILYQIWKFVAPGLYAHEKKYTVIFLVSGTVLFLSGVLFVYFLVYPIAFEFLFGFGGDTDTPMITIREYLSFFILTTIMFGVAFELPLVLVLLGLMGLVDHQFLRKNRRIAVVILALLAALFTPPDIISMSMLLVPMMVLYEIAIYLVMILAPKPATE